MTKATIVIANLEINSIYGTDASVPVVVQYVALNKLHSMHVSSYMQVLDKQSEEQQ